MPRAVAGYPPAWTFKPDPAIEALRLREAEEKERERKRREEEARREREEKERREKEKEERARKEQQEREQREQRERERERERREKERREMERIERERLLQQQRISENTKMQRERSPLRNGNDSDVSRIKEEPKREDEMLMRGPPNVVPDPRYAHAQHLAAQHYMVGRHMMQGQMPPVSLVSHFLLLICTSIFKIFVGQFAKLYFIFFFSSDEVFLRIRWPERHCHTSRHHQLVGQRLV